MNLYIADLHFGHANCIKFDNRPFTDADEMDRCLIELWNARVSGDDNVFILGDFAFKAANDEQWYLRQLRGHKHLIIGNHDDKLLRNEKAMAYFESADKLTNVTDRLDGANINVCLCHYPLIDWDKKFSGSYHIYGHIHNRSRNSDAHRIMAGIDRALNAGCMLNNFMPANITELIANNELFRASIFADRE